MSNATTKCRQCGREWVPLKRGDVGFQEPPFDLYSKYFCNGVCSFIYPYRNEKEEDVLKAIKDYKQAIKDKYA